MSLKNFKIIDLFILTCLAFGTEFLGYFLLENLSTPVYLSFSLAVCFVAMIRWGFVGVITYVAAGFSLFVIKDTENIIASFFYEVVANAAICIPFAIFYKKGENNIMNKTSLFLKVVVLSLVSLILTKGIVLFFVNESLTGIVDYFSVSLLILAMNTGVLMLLTKAAKHLTIDMVYFLTDESRSKEDLE